MKKEMRIYNMDKTLYQIKKDLTISKYSKKIENFSKEKISDKQKDFANVVTNNLLHTYDNKIEITTARCGMGKSELIKSFLYNLVNDAMVMGMPNYTGEPHPFGAIIVTDKLERLEGITKYKGLETRCYFMKWDNKNTVTQERKEFKDQLKEQYKYPILLMTTQKYFRMSKEERNSIYKWRNGRREICIFDERPILVNNIEINEEFLSKIRIALDMIFESEDKRYLIRSFKKIYEDIDYIRENYSSKYEVMWLKKSRETLLFSNEEDKKFFETLEKYVSYDILDKCNKLKEIYTNGGLFVNKKSKEQLNTRNIILLKDNIECFDIEKCKYHILDATGKYDIDYLINKEKYKYINIDDTKEVKDINLIHIPVSTSQNSLKKDKGINAICTWINKSFKENECFVATYSPKTGIYNKFANKIRQPIAYFGNIKGSNEYEDKTNMVHIGMNRQSDIVYLESYILWRRKNIEWNSMNNDDISQEINDLLEMKKGYFTNIAMNTIMMNKLLVDIEQNIFRIKCRHFSNKEECNIYILANDNPFNESLMKRLSDKIGANYAMKMPEVLEEELNKEKLEKRKSNVEGKENTNPQILQEYLSTLEKGTIVKMKDIIDGSGLNRNQIKGARKKNKYIELWFRKHDAKLHDGKRGDYII